MYGCGGQCGDRREKGKLEIRIASMLQLLLKLDLATHDGWLKAA